MNLTYHNLQSHIGYADRLTPLLKTLTNYQTVFNLPLERFLIEYDKAQSEERLRDMLFDLQVSGRRRDIKYALDAHERLYGKIEIEREESIAGIVDWRNPDLFAFESEKAIEVANYTTGVPLIVPARHVPVRR